MADAVNAPAHYTQGSVECIDALEAALGADGFRAYCRGAALKYLWRAPHKGAELEDYRKAAWYIQRIIRGMAQHDQAEVKARPTAAAPGLYRIAPDETSPTGAELIAAERRRQIEVEGWAPEHDDQHEDGDIVAAAIAYAHAENSRELDARLTWWPWDAEWWKPSDDPIRNLVKAGALIAAEIDRRQRAAAPRETDREYAQRRARDVAEGVVYARKGFTSTLVHEVVALLRERDEARAEVARLRSALQRLVDAETDLDYALPDTATERRCEEEVYAAVREATAALAGGGSKTERRQRAAAREVEGVSTGEILQ